MSRILIDLPNDCEKIELYTMGDFHIGSAHFLEEKLQKDIDTIKNNPNALVILNGDLINNATRYSVSDIYEEHLNPEQALDLLTDYLEPVKDKIIGIVSGNHEDRTYKQTGLRPLKNLCYRLNLLDKFDPISNTIFLSFGKSRERNNVKNTYVIYQTHGRGGGSTVGGKVNRVHKLSNIYVNCDVYIHSHTHLPAVFKDSYMLVDTRNKGVSQQDRLFVNTNAYEGFGGYGERMNLPPSNHDMPKVILSYDKKEKIVKANL